MELTLIVVITTDGDTPEHNADVENAFTQIEELCGSITEQSGGKVSVEISTVEE